MLSFLISVLSKLIFMFLRTSGTSFPPPLGKEEELRLFNALKNHNDNSARTKLIEHNLRLVAHIVKKYYISFKEQDDLISIGTIGLIKAIDSFDISKGSRFATYGGKCIQNEILMFFRSSKKLSHESSMNDPVDIDKDGNPLTYLDILYSEDTIIDEIDLKMKSESVMAAIRETLSNREKLIIVLRYGLNNEKPLAQREVALKLNISRSYVSRIEKSAIDKIKKYIGEKRK